MKNPDKPAALGYLALVLHAHLPFIRHPEYPDFLEEDWYFEAATETYGPILLRLENLRRENIPFRLTLNVSPPLASMMEDGLLRDRLRKYLDLRIDLLNKEVRTNKGTHVEKIARHYLEEYVSVRNFIYEQYGGSLLGSIRSLQDTGHLEVITCTATHGLMTVSSGGPAWRGQIRAAVRSHERFFGRSPRGIWLAECGYVAGIEQTLAEEGIEYFFVDTHGIMFGDPQPAYGVYAPVITDAGVSAFARDAESSKQVWSQKEGYPGDADYREFYRDLGYDAEWEYIKPYMHSDGVRRGIGLKYHRITGNVGLGEKQHYDPEKAREKAAEHAGNFMFNRQAQVRFLNGRTLNPPIIISPYDAELFGHWWYEGPQFIEFLIRKLAFDQFEVEMISPGDYLDRHPVRQLQRINPSTWGSEGHNLVWLNGGNAWLYRHQHWAEGKMEELARKFDGAEGDLRRALNQLLRELLLMQASDWAFIMTTGTTVPYATKRFREHLDRFRKLASQIEEARIDVNFVKFLEERDGIFPTVDYRDVLPRVGAPKIQPVA